MYIWQLVCSFCAAGETALLDILLSSCKTDLTYDLLAHCCSLSALISSLLPPYLPQPVSSLPLSSPLRPFTLLLPHISFVLSCAEWKQQLLSQSGCYLNWRESREWSVCVCQGKPAASSLGKMPQWCRKRLNLTSWPTCSIPVKIQTSFLGLSWV